MKKCAAFVIVMILGLSGVASALTYIDTPEGRRPVEGGEWFVDGTVQVDSHLREGFAEDWYRRTASLVTFDYYLTPSISLQGTTQWVTEDGVTASQPYYSVGLTSSLTDNLELQVAYAWAKRKDAQQNSVRVGLYYEHLNH